MAEFTADIGGLAGLVLGLNLLSIITCLRRIFNYISEVSNSLRDLTFIRSAKEFYETDQKDSNGTTTSKHVLLKNCSTETSINQSPLRLSDEKQTFGRSRVPRIGFIIHGRNKCAKRGRGAFVDPWAVLLILNMLTICTFQFTRTKTQSILFSQINKIALNKTQSIIIFGTVLNLLSTVSNFALFSNQAVFQV